MERLEIKAAARRERCALKAGHNPTVRRHKNEIIKARRDKEGRGPASDAGPKKLIEGDTKQVTDVLFAIAETAWSMGWRPRGLAGTLAQVCTSFKIPPPE